MLNILFYIIIALIIVLAIITIYNKIKINGLRATIIQLILYAEKKFAEGQNDSKFEFVLDGIYNLLPAFAKAFISKSTLQRAIQKIFYELKEALDYQKPETVVVENTADVAKTNQLV